MKLYSSNNDYKLYEGSMLDMLEVIEPNSIDSIVTDPPYGLTSITKRFGKENSAECQYGKDGSFQRLSKGFMGKEWDGSGIEYNIEAWKKCYEVLKPGGYLLAFGGSRTFHRIACAIEDAGFEIRDTIMWLYGSGFPKSMSLSKGLEAREKLGNAGTRNKRKIEQACDTEEYTLKQTNNGAMGEIIETTRKEYIPDTELAKQWQGWGTALKPSFEPIIVARKPFKGSLVDNVIQYGVGGINIDECRVGSSKEDIDKLNKEWDREWNTSYKSFADGVGGSAGFDYSNARTENKGLSGRFPANTILTYDETDFDEVCGGFPNTSGGKMKLNSEVKRKGMSADGSSFNSNTCGFDVNKGTGLCNYGDSGSASRYFYCAKASKKDRDEGLDDFEEKPKTLTENKGRTFNDRCAVCGKKFIGSPETICHCENPITDKSKSAMSKNTHPTVKPTELMQYLVRLVSPNGATILDPFNGSGSTGKAVMYENKERNKNYKYIGIELTEEYLPIAKARIEYAYNYKYDDSQLSIFVLEDILRGDNNETK